MTTERATMSRGHVSTRGPDREPGYEETSMLGKLNRDESGMTMALTVVMIALIGVMGAGLLVFVGRDLDTVVEVNRGQKAFEIADAGAQVARQQIRRDAEPEHYDVDDSSSPLHYAENCNDPGDDSTGPPRYGDDWSPEAGVSRNFAGGSFDVTIRWLSRNPAADARCRAPVAQGNEPADARFFLITSTGCYPEDCSGAIRKVETIVSTYDIGVPKAYFTSDDSPDSVTINGSSCISGVSFFSLGGIDTGNSGGGSGCSNGGVIEDEDTAYGNWQNEFNPTDRPTTDAGFGTPGSITGGSEVTGRDYDSGSGFVRDDPTTGQITFPFDYTTQSGDADTERLDFYEEEARLQGNYMELSGNEKLSAWPTNSDYNTVVYVKFTGSGGTLTWFVNGGCDNASRKKGTLVVENGDFDTQPSKALFSGILIVRGGSVKPGSYTDTGNTCFEGFVNASGDIKINGKPAPSTNPELTYTPGLYGVRLWSWRELYE
jgi:hypothetical protein